MKNLLGNLLIEKSSLKNDSDKRSLLFGVKREYIQRKFLVKNDANKCHATFLSYINMRNIYLCFYTGEPSSFSSHVYWYCVQQQNINGEQ